MGKKAKGSRKGKKAWRANISTEDFEDYFEKTTKDALSGGSLAGVPNDSLFFVDKSRENSFTVSGYDNVKIKKKPKRSIIPAVVVEPSGCSFNPHPECHQDSLARAVADEMLKVYQHELQPEPVPIFVSCEVIAEEDKYFLEADPEIHGDNDDDVDDLENENENSTDINGADAEKRPKKTKRVTKVELNRRARRKVQLKTEAEAKQAGVLSKDIDCLSDIIQEIAKEDEEKQDRHLRRLEAKEERLKVRPPRLGKYNVALVHAHVRNLEKRKGDVGAYSYPPMRKTKNIENDFEEAGFLKSSKSLTTVPPKCRKRSCHEPTSADESCLPPNFIKQQRAYFKEVDDFVLEEEEISANELD